MRWILRSRPSSGSGWIRRAELLGRDARLGCSAGPGRAAGALTLAVGVLRGMKNGMRGRVSWSAWWPRGSCGADTKADFRHTSVTRIGPEGVDASFMLLERTAGSAVHPRWGIISRWGVARARKAAPVTLAPSASYSRSVSGPRPTAAAQRVRKTVASPKIGPQLGARQLPAAVCAVGGGRRMGQAAWVLAGPSGSGSGMRARVTSRPRASISRTW